MFKWFQEVLQPAALQIDLAAASIAIIALVFSVVSWRGQNKLALETLRLQRDNDVIAWSNQTIDAICEAETLLRNGHQHLDAGAFLAARDACLARLSSCIEKGRLYFPNFEHENYGIEKESAYRGHRQPILDRLVWIYDLIKDVDPRASANFETLRADIEKHRRGFVSEAQAAVEPRRRISFLSGRPVKHKEPAT
jgi:hypothetical protein